jgi:glycosyltransferase involved in cell wall biosynthesis
MRKRRIVFIISDAAGWAGTERVLNIIASALADAFDILVLSLSVERVCSYAYPAGVTLSWLPLSRNPVVANFALARRINKLAPDTVVLTGLGEVKYLLAALPFRSWRFLAWEHFNAAYTWRRLNRRIVARFADSIITLTERDAADWRRLLKPRCDIVVANNPVPSFPPEGSRLDSKRILAVGRLESQKNYSLLIEAFALASTVLPGWTLRIRGAGSEEAMLRALAAARGVDARIEILPPTDYMAGEYAAASIFAMSSRFEGFPMVLLEAMAAGLPCVSVDCPNGPREIISDGVDGFLTPFGEVAPLAAALGRLAGDDDLRRRFGKTARTSIGRYSIESIRERWLEIIDRY